MKIKNEKFIHFFIHLAILAMCFAIIKQNQIYIDFFQKSVEEFPIPEDSLNHFIQDTLSILFFYPDESQIMYYRYLKNMESLANKNPYLSFHHYSGNYFPDLLEKYKIKKLPAITISKDSSFITEYQTDFQSSINLLFKFHVMKEKKIYFITNHKETDIHDQSEKGISQFYQEIKKMGIKTGKITSLNQLKLLGNNNIYITYSPLEKWESQEIKQIEHNVKAGGTFIIFTDPEQSKNINHLLSPFSLSIDSISIKETGMNFDNENPSIIKSSNTAIEIRNFFRKEITGLFFKPSPCYYQATSNLKYLMKTSPFAFLHSSHEKKEFLIGLELFVSKGKIILWSDSDFLKNQSISLCNNSEIAQYLIQNQFSFDYKFKPKERNFIPLKINEMFIIMVFIFFPPSFLFIIAIIKIIFRMIKNEN